MKFTFSFLALLLCFSLSITSCGSKEGCTDPASDNYDPEAETNDGSCVLSGCTDPEAENYNPDANEENNTCVFAREKFLGDYMGTISSNILITTPSDFTMAVAEGLTGNNLVEVEFKDTPVPFPIVTGFARGDSLILDEKTYQVEVMGVMTDVDITGGALISDDQQSLEGSMDLLLSVSGFPITDVATFSASK